MRSYKMYKLLKNTKTENIDAVLKVSGNCWTTVPFDPANTDYQEYLKWVAEGNEPLPAENE